MTYIGLACRFKNAQISLVSLFHFIVENAFLTADQTKKKNLII